MTVKTAFNHALLTIAFLQELIDSVVAVEAATVIQVEVVGFIAGNTCCQILAIKTVGNVTRYTRFSHYEVINRLVTEGADRSIGIVIVGLITIQTVG